MDEKVLDSQSAAGKMDQNVKFTVFPCPGFNGV